MRDMNGRVLHSLRHRVIHSHTIGRLGKHPVCDARSRERECTRHLARQQRDNYVLVCLPRQRSRSRDASSADSISLAERQLLQRLQQRGELGGVLLLEPPEVRRVVVGQEDWHVAGKCMHQLREIATRKQTIASTAPQEGNKRIVCELAHSSSCPLLLLIWSFYEYIFLLT